MNVTGIALVSPAAAEENPKLTPELLASVLARYSRSNIGLEKILEKVDLNEADASIDRILKFVDYGHASIAGLTGRNCPDGGWPGIKYSIYQYERIEFAGT